MEIANNDYSKKLQTEGTQQKTLLDLAWKLDDLSRLSQDGRALSVDIQSLLEHLEESAFDYVASNIPRQLTRLQEKLIAFLKSELLIVSPQLFLCSNITF